MSKVAFREHRSIQQMADAVAAHGGSIVQSAIAARGAALLVLPGGTTPRPIYAKLAAVRLQWERVTIIPGDERLVAMDSELSNAGAIADAFRRTGARVLPIAGDTPDHRLAGDMADSVVQELPWPPDLVWLGMGEDGHIASIFPGPALDAAVNSSEERRAVGVVPDPLPAEAPVARVTLTLPAIFSARTIIVTTRGEKKRQLLEQAIADVQTSKLPIGQLLARAERAIDIHWCP